MNVVSRTARVSSSLNGCSCPAWKNLDSWGRSARAIGHVTTAAGRKKKLSASWKSTTPPRRRSATMKIANTWAASRPV